MLIALGLYGGVILASDPLLNPAANVGFVMPVEFLQYAAFVIDNNEAIATRLRPLLRLFVQCADEIQKGSPTAFVEFRKCEERMLQGAAKTDGICLNRAIVEFVAYCAERGAVPIGFSDRPNASLGLQTTSTNAYTTSAPEGSLFQTALVLR